MELVEGPMRWEVGPESFQILATTTEARLEWDGKVVTLPSGQSVLLPAGLGSVEVTGNFLRVGVP